MRRPMDFGRRVRLLSATLRFVRERRFPTCGGREESESEVRMSSRSEWSDQRDDGTADRYGFCDACSASSDTHEPRHSGRDDNPVSVRKMCVTCDSRDHSAGDVGSPGTAW